MSLLFDDTRSGNTKERAQECLKIIEEVKSQSKLLGDKYEFLTLRGWLDSQPATLCLKDPEPESDMGKSVCLSQFEWSDKAWDVMFSSQGAIGEAKEVIQLFMKEVNYLDSRIACRDQMIATLMAVAKGQKEKLNRVGTGCGCYGPAKTAESRNEKPDAPEEKNNVSEEKTANPAKKTDVPETKTGVLEETKFDTMVVRAESEKVALKYGKLETTDHGGENGVTSRKKLVPKSTKNKTQPIRPDTKLRFPLPRTPFTFTPPEKTKPQKTVQPSRERSEPQTHQKTVQPRQEILETLSHSQEVPDISFLLLAMIVLFPTISFFLPFLIE